MLLHMPLSVKCCKTVKAVPDCLGDRLDVFLGIHLFACVGICRTCLHTPACIYLYAQLFLLLILSTFILSTLCMLLLILMSDSDSDKNAISHRFYLLYLSTSTLCIHVYVVYCV